MAGGIAEISTRALMSITQSFFAGTVILVDAFAYG